jgi:hypothetical protein
LGSSFQLKCLDRQSLFLELEQPAQLITQVEVALSTAEHKAALEVEQMPAHAQAADHFLEVREEAEVVLSTLGRRQMETAVVWLDSITLTLTPTKEEPLVELRFQVARTDQMGPRQTSHCVAVEVAEVPLR